MDIKAITDKVFRFLDLEVFPIIFDLQPALKEEKRRISEAENNPHQEIKKLKALQQEQNNQVVDKIKPLFQQKLSAILAEAALWFKGDNRPKGDVVWVISPFEFDVMGYALVSVALQQRDELLMGILGNLSNFEMIAGELGGGTWMEDKEFAVAENDLSEVSSNMQFVTKNRNSLSNYTALISAIRKRYNFRTLTNSVDENISYHMTLVARGEMDFTLGIDFSYHDIAAAICIVEQAGGVVTDFNGGKTKLYTGEEFFCSNKIIHQQFMDVARVFLKH